MSHPMRTDAFDWKAFLRALFPIAIPVALQNLLTTSASMVDTVMLATTGPLTVGAVGLCGQFTSLMFSCYWGFVGGGMLFFAQYFGAKDDEGICHSYGLTLLCMMTVGILFGILAVFFPHIVMTCYTDKTAIHEIGVSYLRICGFAYPLQVFSVCASALLRSTERVKIPLMASIVSVATNFICNSILIFGLFGFPAMGVRGAAIGTVAAALVNVLVIVVMASGGRHAYLFRIREHFRFTKALVEEYFTKCFPILCNEFLIGVSNMIINVVLGHQIEEAIVAIAVFRTLEGFVISFFAGFSNAATVLVGTCVGAGDHETAFARGKRIVLLCPIFTLAACLIYIAFHRPLLTVMGLTGLSYDLGVAMVLIYTVMGCIRMTNWAQNDTFRASGDPAFGTILEIAFAYALVVPCVLLSGAVFKLPFLLVFFCCYIDEPIRLVLMLRHTFSGRWIRPVTAEGLATINAFRQRHGIVMKGKKYAQSH